MAGDCAESWPGDPVKISEQRLDWTWLTFEQDHLSEQAGGDASLLVAVGEERKEETPGEIALQGSGWL